MNATSWIAAGAVLTGVAAVATAWMAFYTRKAARDTSEMAKASVREVKAIEEQLVHSAEQVRLSGESLRASVQPWLTWRPEYEVSPDADAGYGPQLWGGNMPVPGAELSESNDGLDGSILVRNVGNGLGILALNESWVLGVDIDDRASSSLRQYVHPSTNNPIIPTGSEATVHFHIPLVSAAWTNLTLDGFAGRPNTNGGFELDLVYTDAVGGSTIRAKFHIACSDKDHSSVWRVWRTEYFVPHDAINPQITAEF
ncbi:MAG: hypothetical protein ACYDEY_09590 [Acidimicrobiales bacterium]